LSDSRVQLVNPDELVKNPAFSHVAVVTGSVKTVYIGGQDAIAAAGNIVGKGDLGAQTEQVLKNLRAALTAAGAGPEHVVKWNIYIVQGQSIQEGFEAFQRVWGMPPNPPLITGVFVAALAHPDFLVEIDAMAVVPE
jgi:enamine deaminase RidA (YjgF/YER057c/UK114 family)